MKNFEKEQKNLDKLADEINTKLEHNERVFERMLIAEDRAAFDAAIAADANTGQNIHLYQLPGDHCHPGEGSCPYCDATVEFKSPQIDFDKIDPMTKVWIPCTCGKNFWLRATEV